MLLRQSSNIDRPAALVWPYIVTPELFRQWNDKIASIEARERFHAGQQFTTHYLWHGREMQCLSVVAGIEEGRLLELRHTRCLGPKAQLDMEIIERVELKSSGTRSTVTKNITVRNHGIPWYLLPLIWLLTRFGTPKGEDKLKTLCEGGT